MDDGTEPRRLLCARVQLTILNMHDYKIQMQNEWLKFLLLPIFLCCWWLGCCALIITCKLKSDCFCCFLSLPVCVCERVCVSALQLMIFKLNERNDDEEERLWLLCDRACVPPFDLFARFFRIRFFICINDFSIFGGFLGNFRFAIGFVGRRLFQQ